MAYIAYHFHWPPDELLDMDHSERHEWLRQIARINSEINDQRNKG